MNKLKFMVLLIVISSLLIGCDAYVIDHSDKSVVTMKIEDKTIDENYTTGCDEHYNILLDYDGSKYILKDRTIFNNVKVLDKIDVMYIIDYDNKDNIINVHIKPINQNTY